ncbi:MAG: hypothetical protein ACRC03_05885, partial [Romboutsia sp.]
MAVYLNTNKCLENYKRLFKISKSDSYDEHLNKYNVINISFNTIPDKNKTYDEYIGLVQNGIIDDIKSMYPTLD